jgi:hypothetical protein
MISGVTNQKVWMFEVFRRSLCRAGMYWSQPARVDHNAWMMFDHVKRVKKWTTMACHVYDSTYCRVMTIAVCDMQLEDATAQSVLWKNLNAVLARHGVLEPKFKGFMADSAQANWNAIRVIYGSGDAAIPMKD